MPGLGTTATSLITTKGLFVLGAIPSGNTGLSYGTVITPWFRLYIDQNAPPPIVTGGGDGGSRVYAPGTFANAWQPIDPTTGKATIGPNGPSPMPYAPVNPQTGHRIDNSGEQEPWFVVPRDKEKEFFGEQSGRIVTVKMNFAGKELERVFKVNERQGKKIVEVINLINSTKQRIAMSISGMKRVVTKALVEVRNIRLRYKPNK